MIAGQVCFWGEVVWDLRVEVCEDACDGVGGLVGDAFVVVDDDLLEECLGEDAAFSGFGFGVEVVEVGEDAGASRLLLPLSPLTIVSYNIKHMSERETIDGAPVTEEQIAAWADEAEAGYDIAALKKRGRGRPGRGAEPSQVIALRLTADEISALDARAEREGKSRSEVIREALASA